MTALSPGQSPPQVTIPQASPEGSWKILSRGPASSREGSPFPAEPPEFFHIRMIGHPFRITLEADPFHRRTDPAVAELLGRELRGVGGHGRPLGMSFCRTDGAADIGRESLGCRAVHDDRGGQAASPGDKIRWSGWRISRPAHRAGVRGRSGLRFWFR
jgi:hypothetical protein